MRPVVYRLTVTEGALREKLQTLSIQGGGRLFLGVFVIATLLSLHDTRVKVVAPVPPQVVAFSLLPAVVQNSPTGFQISRFGIVQRLIQEHVQVYDVLDNDLTPLVDGDRIAGFRLGDVERCPLFKELGVRNGDILRAVNGEPLQSIWEMYLRFRYVAQADVTVERQGQLVSLRYWID